MKLAEVQFDSAPAMPRTKLASTSFPRGRVHDLGMELDAVEAALGVGQAGVGSGVGLGRGLEAAGQPGDGVAVAHPHRLLGAEVAEAAGRSRR